MKDRWRDKVWYEVRSGGLKCAHVTWEGRAEDHVHATSYHNRGPRQTAHLSPAGIPASWASHALHTACPGYCPHRYSGGARDMVSIVGAKSVNSSRQTQQYTWRGHGARASSRPGAAGARGTLTAGGGRYLPHHGSTISVTADTSPAAPHAARADALWDHTNRGRDGARKSRPWTHSVRAAHAFRARATRGAQTRATATRASARCTSCAV